MKNVKSSGKNTAAMSHDKVEFVDPEQERDYSSSEPTGSSYVATNRREVEAKKAQPISEEQMTSKLISDIVDLGSESLTSGSAASQTGIANFRETRIISNALLRKRALEALKQAEQRREEFLLQETSPESNSIEN
jgi:hypothetical protein